MAEGKFEDDAGFVYLGMTREQKAESAAKPFDSKKNCWIPDDEEGWKLHSIPLKLHSFFKLRLPT